MKKYTIKVLAIFALMTICFFGLGTEGNFDTTLYELKMSAFLSALLTVVGLLILFITKPNNSPPTDKENLNNYEKDENGYFKIIDGEKIYQIEEKNESDKATNDAINEWREFGGGLSPMQYLHKKYR